MRSRFNLPLLGRFFIVACIALLTWWQVSSNSSPGQYLTLALAGIGAIAAYLTIKSKRLGLWLSAILGGSYLAQLFYTVSSADLIFVSPMIGWAGLTLVISLVLLWVTREKERKDQTEFERHTPY